MSKRHESELSVALGVDSAAWPHPAVDPNAPTMHQYIYNASFKTQVLSFPFLVGLVFAMIHILRINFYVVRARVVVRVLVIAGVDKWLRRVCQGSAQKQLAEMGDTPEKTRAWPRVIFPVRHC